MDLKQREESFSSALDDFLTHASDDTRDTIQNIEFFHECSKGVRVRGEPLGHDQGLDIAQGNVGVNTEDLDCLLNDQGDQTDAFDDVVTEEHIRSILDKPFSAREMLYAETAMGIGMNSGVWPDKECDAACHGMALQPTTERMTLFPIWKEALNTVGHGDNDMVHGPSLTDASASVPDDWSAVMPPSSDGPSARYAAKSHMTCTRFLLVRSRFNSYIPADFSDMLFVVTSFSSFVFYVFLSVSISIPFYAVP